MAIRNFSKTYGDLLPAPAVDTSLVQGPPLRIEIDPSDSHFSQTVQLDGRTWTLQFDWNAREGSWYVGLLDENDAPVFAGRKVVADWYPMRNVVGVNRPPGQLVFVDTTGAGADPGRLELGARVALYYLAAADLDLMGPDGDPAAVAALHL